MSNLTVTNIDLGNVALGDDSYADEVITFTGAGTLAAGTLLARDSVSLKLVPFVKGGATNENGIPKAVITTPVTATGAGDVTARPLVSGKVNGSRLVIDADGDNSNVDAAVTDALRGYGIVVVDSTELAVLDNQ